MLNKYKVSVVIPFYNMEQYLQSCLDSVCRQTLQDIEIICVDDGSTDNTTELLTEYARSDSRIKIITQHQQGVSAARNRGISAANGEYLSILDADDFFHLDMLEHSYYRAKETNADICIFKAEEYNESTGQTCAMDWTPRRHWLPPQEIFSSYDIEDRIFIITPGWAWDKLFKTSFIKKHQITFQNQRTTNDARFVFMAYALAQRICLCENAIAVHRTGRRNALSVTREQSWDCFYKAFLSLEDELKKSGQYDRLEHGMRNWVLDFAQWNLDTITGERRLDVYNLIKHKIYPHYHIWDYPLDYYRWPDKYPQALWIKDLDYEAYLTVENHRRKIPPAVIADKTIIERYRENAPVAKISVIISTHNNSHDICDCLNCLTSQTLKNIEIICVDGDSHDGTLQLLQEYEKSDPRIRVVKENSCHDNHELLQALNIVHGKYVVCISPLDRLEPYALDQCFVSNQQLTNNRALKEAIQINKKPVLFADSNITRLW